MRRRWICGHFSMRVTGGLARGTNAPGPHSLDRAARATVLVNEIA
jgi:hypothetical protein